MKTLNERLTAAFNILIENGVFLVKYNKDAYCKCPDEQLHLVTNHLSLSDIKLIYMACDFYHLDCSIFECPSISGNRLSVIISESNHG